MSKGFTTSYRIALLAIGIFGMFGVLEARLVWLHVINRDFFLRSVDEARRQLIVDTARRGDIVDTHGALLATSRSIVVLGVDPQFIRPEDRPKWPRLAELLQIPLADLQRAFLTKTRPVAAKSAAGARSSAVITLAGPAAPAAAAAEPAATAADDATARDDTEYDEPDSANNRPIRWAKLSDQVPESVYSEVNKLNIRGVYGRRIYHRDYPGDELAAHVVGFVNAKERPMAGMEYYADFYLRGENGWMITEKDGKSHELAQFRTREVPAVDGFNVTLSIDSTIQRMAEDELAKVAAQYDPKKATIVVSDPQTGFVLALANYPSFDLNTYNKLTKAEQVRMRNVALADEYEPGSVFKIVAVSGALNDGLVTTQSEFDCTLDKIDYNGLTRNLPREDASDHFTHPLSVAEIVAHSSNKGAAQLAMKLGDQRFYAYARAFGFGQHTGFPVGGEVAGNLKAPDKWDSLTITRMPMGQSVTATVLQMQQAMGVMASGGLLLRPQVIRQIRDSRNELVYSFGPAVERRVVSEQTAHTMAHLLTGVVSPEGNCMQAFIPGYEVAGKTGTAQKLLPETVPNGRTEMRYSNHHHVASFVGFFPASHPQVAIAVIIDDADAHAPNGVAFGNAVAAPVFKRLGLRLIPYLDIRPTIQSDPQPAALALGDRR